MTDPWWLDVAPVEAELPCGAGRHVVRWEAGELLTPAHADPDGEAVLVALGGGEPECLRLRRAWQAHTSDPRLLVLGSRHPGDEIHLDFAELALMRDLPNPTGQMGAGNRLVTTATATWSGYAPLTPVRPPPAPVRRAPRITTPRQTAPMSLSTSGGGVTRPPWLTDKQWHAHIELLSLLALDGRLQRRLQAHVATALLARSDRSARAALEAATIGRLRPVLKRWAPDRQPTTTVSERPGVGPEGGVTVGWDWLLAVWCRYLALVDGFLVLEVHRLVTDRAEVTAIGPEPRAEAARLTLRGPAPWRVVARA
jgi:hypothetical protein